MMNMINVVKYVCVCLCVYIYAPWLCALQNHIKPFLMRARETQIKTPGTQEERNF